MVIFVARFISHDRYCRRARFHLRSNFWTYETFVGFTACSHWWLYSTSSSSSNMHVATSSEWARDAACDHKNIRQKSHNAGAWRMTGHHDVIIRCHSLSFLSVSRISQKKEIVDKLFWIKIRGMFQIDCRTRRCTDFFLSFSFIYRLITMSICVCIPFSFLVKLFIVLLLPITLYVYCCWRGCKWKMNIQFDDISAFKKFLVPSEFLPRDAL